MKKIILLLILLTIRFFVYPQVPNMFNYQGIARNVSGQPLASTNISIRISILDGSSSGTTLYSETRSVTTNQLGIFTIAIGSSGAQNTTGNFASINWANNFKYIKVEADVAGGNNFSLLGNTQLLSVPYALYAGSAPATVFTAGTGISIAGNT